MAVAVGMMVGSAILNAVAFTGGNALFSMLNKQGADTEKIRHDKAMEDLQQAQADFSRTRQEHLDYLNDRLRAEGHAEKVYEDVTEAMRVYHDVVGEKADIPPSRLSSFYTPSPDQQ
jgi:hypothetical protein